MNQKISTTFEPFIFKVHAQQNTCKLSINQGEKLSKLPHSLTPLPGGGEYGAISLYLSVVS